MAKQNLTVSGQYWGRASLSVSPLLRRFDAVRETPSILCHATCVAINGQGVLLRGRSGSGKSDLALRLIDAKGIGFTGKPRRCAVLADDQVQLNRVLDQIIASAPDTLQGLLEIRGVGIVKLRPSPPLALSLIVDLVAHSLIERLPEPAQTEILGVRVPVIKLDPSLAGATARLFAALELPDGLLRSR